MNHSCMISSLNFVKLVFTPYLNHPSTQFQSRDLFRSLGSIFWTFLSPFGLSLLFQDHHLRSDGIGCRRCRLEQGRRLLTPEIDELLFYLLAQAIQLLSLFCSRQCRGISHEIKLHLRTFSNAKK